MTIVNCKFCNKKINKWPSEIKRSKEIFCSEKCRALSKRNRRRVECATCHKLFEVPGSRVSIKYCSLECKKADKKLITINCHYCGKIFNKYLNQITRSITHYCSVDCFHASYKNQTTYICLNCKNERTVPTSQTLKKFCSFKCLAEWRKENHRITVKCKVCGKILNRNLAKINSRISSFCSPVCYAKSMKISEEEFKLNRKLYTRKYRSLNKEKTQAWKQNRRVLVSMLGGSFSEEEWIKCKEKYNNRCAICGVDEIEKKLTVDHIIPIAKWTSWIKDKQGIGYQCGDIKNIQPLCYSCNSKKSAKIL